jgi:uncharacterized protein
MPKANLRFYEELNDYLPPEKQKKDFEVCFEDDRMLGWVLEKQGVPRDDVDLILVNGQSVDFDYELQDGDRVSIYPVFERFDIGRVTNLKDRPLRVLRFVVEKQLADVADRLRGLGFDVKCDPELGAEEAVEISRKEQRILLTTRIDIVLSGKITHGLYIEPGGVENQVLGIVEDLNL